MRKPEREREEEMSRGIQKVGTDLVCELANVFVSKTNKIPKAKEVRNCSLY